MSLAKAPKGKGNEEWKLLLLTFVFIVSSNYTSSSLNIKFLYKKYLYSTTYSLSLLPLPRCDVFSVHFYSICDTIAIQLGLLKGISHILIRFFLAFFCIYSVWVCWTDFDFTFLLFRLFFFPLLLFIIFLPMDRLNFMLLVRFVFPLGFQVCQRRQSKKTGRVW